MKFALVTRTRFWYNVCEFPPPHAPRPAWTTRSFHLEGNSA